jgi:hypothetical protein
MGRPAEDDEVDQVRSRVDDGDDRLVFEAGEDGVVGGVEGELSAEPECGPGDAEDVGFAAEVGEQPDGRAVLDAA